MLYLQQEYETVYISAKNDNQFSRIYFRDFLNGNKMRSQDFFLTNTLT